MLEDGQETENLVFYTHVTPPRFEYPDTAKEESQSIVLKKTLLKAF